MNDESIIVPEGPVPMNIATISAGFEKGDFLVREEQGNRVYFDFFEEVRVVKYHLELLKMFLSMTMDYSTFESLFCDTLVD